MPGPRDHRVLPVDAALGDLCPRVGMNVTENMQAFGLANVPELREAPASYVDVTHETVRVEVVEVDDPCNSTPRCLSEPEEKGACLSLSTEASPTELLD